MNRVFNIYYPLLSILVFVAMLAGCNKPGPIDLTLPDQPQNPIDLVTPTNHSQLLSTNDIDSLKILSPKDDQGFGQLLIEGSEYQSQTEHHSVSVARAIFYNNASPVVMNGDTVSFSTLNVGSVGVDLLNLQQIQKHYINPSGTVDSVLGVQYVLYDKDSASGNGFLFHGSKAYHWHSLGTLTIPPFDKIVMTPPGIQVLSPNVQSIIRSSNNLTVRWTGGADTVRIYVRSIENGFPAKTLFQLVVKDNRGSVLIPKTILGLLPKDQTQFLFTFTSSQTSLVNLGGISGDVEVQTVTTENIVLQVRP
ncbi:MAG: hypothetical protein ACHQQQ_12170 [Bacteroidota bacterium]